MNDLLTAFRSCSSWIHWLAGLSLASLLLKVLVLDQIPAPVAAFVPLGGIVQDLLAANLAAYIFFILSAQLPAAVERRHMGPAIAMLAHSAANRVTGFLQMVSTSVGNGTLKPDEVTESDVDRLFAQVSPNAAAPMAGPAPQHQSLTWLMAMSAHAEQTRQRIDQLLRHARYLDSEVTRLADDIYRSPHMESVQQVAAYAAGTGLRNADLKVFARNYWECYQLARRLDALAERLPKG